MTDLTKKCARCAEIVKYEALVCRYCQAELPPPDPLVRQGYLEDARVRQQLVLAALGIAAVGVVIATFYNQIADPFRPEPVKMELAELERQFDQDTAAALIHWRDRPMLLSAKIYIGKGDTVMLESIFPFSVQAHVNRPLVGGSGEPINLHCRNVVEGGLIGGKPDLLNCDVVSLGS